VYKDQEIPCVDMVLKILYATEDEKVEVDEVNGNLSIVNTAEEAEEAPPAEEEPDEEEYAEEAVVEDGEEQEVVVE